VAVVRFFSLQVGPRITEAASWPGLNDLAPQLADFTETAAAVARLDLVITVDTAVAHVAGALARPVWIMLAHEPDWRWLAGRTDSPWYPTARLFRQARFNDWAGVAHDVAAALATLAADHAAGDALAA
jgi:ADP-heptose:LPS heptosyltransferase